MSSRGSELISEHQTGPGVSHIWRLSSLQDAVGTLHLTHSGTPSYVAGRNSNAIDFNSIQGLWHNTDTLKSLFTGAFTLEYWINPRGVGSHISEDSGNIFTYLASTNPGAGDLHWIFNHALFDAGGGKVMLYVYWNPTSDSYQEVDFDVDPDGLLDINTWSHVAIRKTLRPDGKLDLDYFKNGSRIAICHPYSSDNDPAGENPDMGRGMPNMADIGTTGYTLFIGGCYTFKSGGVPVGYDDGQGDNGPFDGRLDDIRLSNFARTDRDILESYRKGL